MAKKTEPAVKKTFSTAARSAAKNRAASAVPDDLVPGHQVQYLGAHGTVVSPSKAPASALVANHHTGQLAVVPREHLDKIIAPKPSNQQSEDFNNAYAQGMMGIGEGGGNVANEPANTAPAEAGSPGTTTEGDSIHKPHRALARLAGAHQSAKIPIGPSMPSVPQMSTGGPGY